MPNKPIWRELAYSTLREHGPMSKADLIELLGPKGNAAAASIATARHEHPGKFFRVTRYDVQRGRAGREIPIYAAAPGADAPRPDFGTEQARKDRQRRYYQRNQAQILARTHARRGKATPAAMWLTLLQPKERRDVANSARMAARSAPQ